MRHRKGFNHLGRTSSHRKAMLANMACSLIKHKRITTTTAKAKALRSYVEPLITKSKEDSTHARRLVFSYLQDKDAVSELFREVAGKIAERPGGYTRILKIGNRIGDNADMCVIELVDYNELMLGTEETKQKGSRRRRGSKKKTESPKAAARETSEAEVKSAEPEEQPAEPEAIAQEELAAETASEPGTGGEEPETGEETEPAEGEAEEVAQPEAEAAPEKTEEEKEQEPDQEPGADEEKKGS